jgi:hypothetical protein
MLMQYGSIKMITFYVGFEIAGIKMGISPPMKEKKNCRT